MGMAAPAVAGLPADAPVWASVLSAIKLESGLSSL